MQIRVGITDNDLKGKTHAAVKLSSSGRFAVSSGVDGEGRLVSFEGGTVVAVRVSSGQLVIEAAGRTAVSSGGRVRVRSLASAGTGTRIELLHLKRPGLASGPIYAGEIELSVVGGKIAVVVFCALDSYLRGVLQSEIPGSYRPEAIKAQAVTARTYALRPRISHADDGFDVCDSYLCCQYFAGMGLAASKTHEKAIEETAGEILVEAGKPILALFSSCAGGHTESYENCFSDPRTGQFPCPPLPYLKGVAEGSLPSGYPAEGALRTLWQLKNVSTADAWSPHFRWHVRLSDRQLEGQMHHVIETMLADPEFRPFIEGPASKKFGHIDRFEVVERGVAGTAMTLTIHTSTGIWKVRKELVIRSVFKNSEAGLARLKSARLFFDHHRNSLGLLDALDIYGFGWGHGVGLQQTGAQGWAMKGKTYRQILSHYFPGAAIEKLS